MRSRAIRAGAGHIKLTCAALRIVHMPQHLRSSSPVSDHELIETVTRMEARLGAHSAHAVADLMKAYRELVPRFEADLDHSARETALAKASALMLIQEVARSEDAS